MYITISYACGRIQQTLSRIDSHLIKCERRASLLTWWQLFIVQIICSWGIGLVAFNRSCWHRLSVRTPYGHPGALRNPWRWWAHPASRPEWTQIHTRHTERVQSLVFARSGGLVHVGNPVPWAFPILLSVGLSYGYSYGRLTLRTDTPTPVGRSLCTLKRKDEIGSKILVLKPYLFSFCSTPLWMKSHSLNQMLSCPWSP